MVIQAKDVLLDDSIEAGFDEAQILADMEALAVEAGDWRNHLPYAAALTYYTDPAIITQYEGHVDDCQYCQRLIEALHPSDEIIGELDAIRVEGQIDDGALTVVPQDRNDGMRVAPWSMAAALVVTVSISWIAFSTLNSRGLGENGTATLALESFLNNPGQLAQLEQSDDSLAKFRAARIYLATEHPELAYQRLGEGLAFAKVDNRVVARVSTAPILTGNASESLSMAAAELEALNERRPLEQDDVLRVMQLRAQLGQHEAALATLKSYLEIQGEAERVLADFEKADLVKD